MFKTTKAQLTQLITSTTQLIKCICTICVGRRYTYEILAWFRNKMSNLNDFMHRHHDAAKLLGLLLADDFQTNQFRAQNSNASPRGRHFKEVNKIKTYITKIACSKQTFNMYRKLSIILTDVSTVKNLINIKDISRTATRRRYILQNYRREVTTKNSRRVTAKEYLIWWKDPFYITSYQ